MNELIKSMPGKGRGLKTEIAQLLNCMPGYVSQVLSGELHFNLEQADILSGYLKLDQNESRYFLLLVQFARSGTPSLKTHFEELIREEKNKALNFNKRHAAPEKSGLDITKYFSTWEYSYLHVLVTLPKIRTFDAIKSKSGINENRLKLLLEELVSMGVLELNQKEYRPSNQGFHLPKDSHAINNHHTNWRIKTIEALKNQSEYDLHYSSVVTLSKEDFIKIKQDLVDQLNLAKAKIKDSPEEIICSLSFDFFELR